MNNKYEGYFCATCKYMKDDKNSPTGYTCTKFNFPDKPYGCCDGWEKIELKKGKKKKVRSPFDSVPETN